MEWTATGAVLIAARAIHFAATALIAGTIIFDSCIAKPVLERNNTTALAFRRRAHRSIGTGLSLAVVTGVIWLLMQAAAMSGMPLDEALNANVLSTVVGETQFGQVTIIRAGLAICLGCLLILDRAPVTAQWLGVAAAAGFAGSLAWAGHAGGTVGTLGYVHLAADALHVLAASAWIGGLLSLIPLLMTVTKLRQDLSLARDVIERFSILGIASVAILLFSGAVNAAILVRSPLALVTTDYGRVLMLKLAVFAAMLAFAAINRLRLTPRLAFIANEPSPVALSHLVRNSIIEAILGLIILAIVAVLGTMHPAAHLMDMPMD